MKLYKLTDENGRTRNNTRWGEGVTHSGTGEGGLCGPGYVHAYEDPYLAVLLNPIHGNFENPRMWEAEGDVALRDGQLKCGCVTLTTVREIPVPPVSAEQRVRFAVLCALEVCRDAAFAKWAEGWLDGTDRSEAAAEEAARAVAAVRTVATARTAARAAAKEARAAEAAAVAAEAVAWAVAWTADIDLAAIAKKAVETGRRTENEKRNLV